MELCTYEVLFPTFNGQPSEFRMPTHQSMSVHNKSVCTKSSSLATIISSTTSYPGATNESSKASLWTLTTGSVFEQWSDPEQSVRPTQENALLIKNLQLYLKTFMHMLFWNIPNSFAKEQIKCSYISLILNAESQK